jgi:LCP family protein required for cell wall assembly
VKLIPHTRAGMLWRFLVVAVVVIGGTAATTAVAGLLQVQNLVNDIPVGSVIPTAPIKIAYTGQPQTILVIGSDHRAGESFRLANTDTMLLVRLDQNSKTINVLSIPRDLEVEIPGFGINKINAAYSLGGTPLMVKTIQADVFPQLKVNHIVDVSFHGFAALVDAIGCVYSDIDHRYYNNTAITDYSSIDIQPGYQKLCGTEALAFVRFRHTDSDLVRNARQQDFIRWAKDQYGIGNLIANRDRLLRIFGSNTQVDRNLRSEDGLLNLFQLVALSAGHTIKQIKFPAAFTACSSGAAAVPGVAAATGGTPCYDTSTPVQEASVFKQFMKATTAAQATASKTKATSPARRRGGRGGGINTAGLSADLPDGRSQAAQLSKVRMPIYYPRLITTGSQYCLGLIANCPLEQASPGSYPRGYVIHDAKGVPHAAYRMTIVLNSLLGQYYGVQGTTWMKPPLLANPTETKTVAGHKLLLFANGSRLTTVAWKTATGVYWISNTLDSVIPNSEMVGMAASLIAARH